jgi:rubrerythrin
MATTIQELRTGRNEDAAEAASAVERVYGLEVSSALAYDKALDLVGSGPLRDQLRFLALEHQRHAVALLEVEVRAGHLAPAADPDLDGLAIAAPGASRRALAPGEVLEAMCENEQLTRTAYAGTLARPLPGETRELLRALEEDERGYLDRVRSLAERAPAKMAAAR